jgi:hypothetical protein
MIGLLILYLALIGFSGHPLLVSTLTALAVLFWPSPKRFFPKQPSTNQDQSGVEDA